MPQGVKKSGKKSGAHAGEFLVCGDVDDFELFGMEARFGAERELSEVALFHFDEVFFVLRAQALEDGGMNDDAQLEIRLVARAPFQDFAELALDLDAHGKCALDLAAAFAVRAIIIDGGMDTFGMPLPGHFQKTQ